MFAATKFVLCTSLLDSLHWEEYFFNVLKYNTSLYRVNQQLHPATVRLSVPHHVLCLFFTASQSCALLGIPRSLELLL